MALRDPLSRQFSGLKPPVDMSVNSIHPQHQKHCKTAIHTHTPDLQTGQHTFQILFLVLDLPFPAVAPRDSGIRVEHRHPSVAVPSCNSWLCLCQTESRDNSCSPPNTAILPRLVLTNSKKGRRRVGVTTPVAPTMQRSNSFRLGTPLTSSSNLEVGPPALRWNPQTPGT